MNMFARFDENTAMTLQDIKKTKRCGRTDNMKTVYPPQTKFAGGIIKVSKGFKGSTRGPGNKITEYYTHGHFI